jgi:predicted dehydrogenase
MMLSLRGSAVLLTFCLLCPALSAQTKIAFVGLVHSHCWTQLRNVGTIEGVELVGIAEPEPELVAEAKSLVPNTEYFSDYRELVEKKKPDIVWAFIENNRHLEIAAYLAPRKVHMIFEKPLASTLEDARKIRDLAVKNKVQVMTNYQMAWWPTNQEIKRQAAAGAIGEVLRLRGIVGHGGPGSEGARSKFFFDWLTDPVKNGAGALVDFGCYNALWALWIKGRPETVYARVDHLQPQRFPKVEDNSVLVLGYKDGVGIFEGSWDLPRSYQDLEIFGRDGSLYMTREALEQRKARGGPQRIEPMALSPERSDPIRYMASRVKSGEATDNIVALDINVDVVEILEAAKQSVATGREVKLPPRQH